MSLIYVICCENSILLDAFSNLATMFAKLVHRAKSKENSARGPLYHINWAIPATTKTDSQCNYTFENVNAGCRLPNGRIPMCWENSMQVLHNRRQFLDLLRCGLREIVHHAHSNSNHNSQSWVWCIESIEWNV